jgi:hypothetical protein
MRMENVSHQRRQVHKEELVDKEVFVTATFEV